MTVDQGFLKDDYYINGIQNVPLTEVAGIIHKDDLLQQVLGRPVDDAVHCPQQYGWPLIVKDDHDGSARQIVRVLHTFTPEKATHILSYLVKGVYICMHQINTIVCRPSTQCSVFTFTKTGMLGITPANLP